MPSTALITGCSSGLGEATARTFEAAGWNVVATMRDAADWRHPVSARLLATALDVTDPASVTSALELSETRFGGLDAVVNIAGVGLFSVFEGTPDATAREVFEVNTFGPIEVMRQAVPHLRRSGGVVVNLTSASSVVPEPLMAYYNASKAALDNLSESVRYEFATQGVRIKVVEPGLVPTTELLGKAETLAQGLPLPPGYEAYVGQRMEHFRSESSFRLATPEDVGAAVLEAATDTSARLRWVVGEDQDERMHARHSTSEAEYLQHTWDLFGPRGS